MHICGGLDMELDRNELLGINLRVTRTDSREIKCLV